MGDFKKLVAWQHAQELVTDLYLTFAPRRTQRYPGLRGQILRAAASIPANLAEGCGKRTRRDLARFAETAYASAKEVESHLISASAINVITRQEFENLARKTDRVAKLCYGLANPRA